MNKEKEKKELIEKIKEYAEEHDIKEIKIDIMDLYDKKKVDVRER